MTRDKPRNTSTNDPEEKFEAPGAYNKGFEASLVVGANRAEHETLAKIVAWLRQYAGFDSATGGCASLIERGDWRNGDGK